MTPEQVIFGNPEVVEGDEPYNHDWLEQGTRVADGLLLENSGDAEYMITHGWTGR